MIVFLIDFYEISGVLASGEIRLLYLSRGCRGSGASLGVDSRGPQCGRDVIQIGMSAPLKGDGRPAGAAACNDGGGHELFSRG